MNECEVHEISDFSDLGEWELARGLPDPALRSFVRRYTGYIEQETFFSCRLEVPSPQVVMVVNFGPAIGVASPWANGAEIEIGSFVSGLYDHPVLVRSTGPMRCVQVDLTPIGARLLIDQPMRNFTNRSISLDDLLGDRVNSIEDNIHSLKTWTDRFRLLDCLLIGRLRNASPVAPAVVWG